jgi:MurNAc alpha-1-phosphate uridylyltransferase
MILAAGRGERMRPLTDDLPKPLLSVAGKTLIEHQIAGLQSAGIDELVINHAWLGDRIVAHLGDGSRLGVSIQYSAEPPGALETGGGIRQALYLLGNDPFLVLNADVWTDFDYTGLLSCQPAGAHLVLVDNPLQHAQGDFFLSHGQVVSDGNEKLTYSGIGVYHPRFFSACDEGRFPLAPLLHVAIERGEVSGQCYSGRWFDVGTPQRLEQLEQLLA